MRASNVADSLGINDPRIRRGMQLPEALTLGEGLRIDSKGRMALDFSTLSVEGTREILSQISSVVRIDRAITIDKTVTLESDFDDTALRNADIALGEQIGGLSTTIGAAQGDISFALGQLLELEGLLNGQGSSISDLVERLNAAEYDIDALQSGTEQLVWVTSQYSLDEHVFVTGGGAAWKEAGLLATHSFALPEGTSRIVRIEITFDRGTIIENNISNNDANAYCIWYPNFRSPDGTLLTPSTPGYRKILQSQTQWSDGNAYSSWNSADRLNESIMFYFAEESQTFTYYDETWGLSNVSLLPDGTYGLSSVDLVGGTVTTSAAGEGAEDNEHFVISGTFTIRYACI